jgi:hypothetical protein
MRTSRSWWRRELCLFGLASGAGQSAIGNLIRGLQVCSAARATLEQPSSNPRATLDVGGHLTPREIFQRPGSAFPHVLAQRCPSRIAAPQDRPRTCLCLGGVHG